MKDKKVLISSLWVFLMFNYIYCDILSNMESDTLNELLTGEIGGMTISEGFLLGAAILMEIPMIMFLVSKLLKRNVSRPANIVAGIFMSIVQFGSLFVGSGITLHYGFYSTIEISTALFIAWTAWNWEKEK